LKLSVIIATRDRQHIVSVCINSLIEQISFDNDDVEIIVVNQGQPFKENILSPEIKLIQYNGFGASKARNFGAQFASGEYLWFLDDDATVLSLDLNKIDGINKLYFVRWKERRLPMAEFFLKWKFFYSIGLLQYSGTPMYIIKKNCFDDIGRFDEQIGPGMKISGGEDADLLLRLHRLLGREPFNVTAEFSHFVEKQNSEKLKKYAFCRGYILRKNCNYFLIIVNFFLFAFRSLRYRNSLFLNFKKGLFFYEH